MKKLLYKLQDLKSSFWFVPLLIIITGIILANSFLYIDFKYGFTPKGLLQIIFSGSPDSARSVLSSIAAAMIGVAGTVFSITLVVLTLASSQFGPRLLGNFMYKRLNQIVLGVYVSTYLYCLIILNSVTGSEGFNFVPTLSVLFSIILAVVSIILLIMFIHQVSVSIQPSKIIADISKELEKNIKNLFPAELGKPINKEYSETIQQIKKELTFHSQITSDDKGYLQFIDSEQLLSIAEKENLFLDIKFKPGEYVIKDAVISKVFSKDNLTENTIDLIKNSFAVANKKTTFQDTEFAIHQIVEIAAKALSPGINDPYTAINCIDNLTSTLSSLTKLEFPSKYRNDKKNILRIITTPLTFSGMLDAAFNQIRQFGAAIPSVIIRLMEALDIIYTNAQNDEQKKAIERHAKMVLETGEKSFQNSQDFMDLKSRFSAFDKQIF